MSANGARLLRERVDELFGFTLAVAAEASVRERRERGACLVLATEPHEADGAVVARLEREASVGVLLEVAIPPTERTQRILLLKVSAVRGAVELEFGIWR